MSDNRGTIPEEKNIQISLIIYSFKAEHISIIKEFKRNTPQGTGSYIQSICKDKIQPN